MRPGSAGTSARPRAARSFRGLGSPGLKSGRVLVDLGDERVAIEVDHLARQARAADLIVLADDERALCDRVQHRTALIARMPRFYPLSGPLPRSPGARSRRAALPRPPPGPASSASGVPSRRAPPSITSPASIAASARSATSVIPCAASASRSTLARAAIGAAGTAPPNAPRAGARARERPARIHVGADASSDQRHPIARRRSGPGQSRAPPVRAPNPRADAPSRARQRPARAVQRPDSRSFRRRPGAAGAGPCQARGRTERVGLAPGLLEDPRALARDLLRGSPRRSASAWDRAPVDTAAAHWPSADAQHGLGRAPRAPVSRVGVEKIRHHVDDRPLAGDRAAKHAQEQAGDAATPCVTTP